MPNNDQELATTAKDIAPGTALHAALSSDCHRYCSSFRGRGSEGASQAGTIAVKDFLGHPRIIHDFDGDGWDDLWCGIHRNLKHRNKTTDTDGDGLTDYEEMVMWRNPFVKGPLPHEPTPEEIEEGKRRSAEQAAARQARLVAEWPAKEAELRRTLRTTFDSGQPDPDSIRHDNVEQRLAVAKRLADGVAAQPAVERKLNDIAAKYGIPSAGTDDHGRGWTLVGESVSGPVLMTSQNARAADTIRVDDLWPTGLYSWQDAALTRSLTGNGVTTSIFEAGNTPGILTNHSEFQGRASIVGSLPPGNHATAVADVIAGGGVLNVYRNSVNQGKMLRGVAYQSSIRGHDLFNFVTNTANSVSAGHRFSNHSYGLSGGWRVALFFVGGVPTWLWVWERNSFTEEPRFGLYSPPDAATGTGISSEELDQFVYGSQVQLPVYAAGNPNNIGPASLPSPFYVTYVNGVPTASTATRDWINGDDGGFDTVLAPGTAKNVLTVGSVLDMLGPPTTLSDFSGTGPTDDGRIKPDVVAVGERNPSLGQGGSLFLAHAASTTSYYDGVNPDSNGVVDYAGTSFAAPQVQGGLALAQQRRTQLHPTAGPLLASTWRALAIHTAQDIDAPGPDYRFGWGIFDAVKVVETLEDDAALGRGALIKEFEIAQGQPLSFLIELPANAAGSLTLAWTDPAGNPADPLDTALDVATPMLVNDLDLSVQDTELGATHLPWILNPDLTNESAVARAAAATTGTDNLNNVERIDIAASGAARKLRVTITPQGMITDGPQKVSLILTGAAPADPHPTAFVLSGNPTNPDEMAMTLDTDPGAYFTLQTSTDLTSWSDGSGGTLLTDDAETTVLVNKNPSEVRRFWRLRRGE